MQTRHRKQSRDTAHEKDPTLKKRGPGRPPLIKKHTEASRQSDNKNDTRNKKNTNRNQDGNEQEQTNENEPLDIQSTFDFQFPPQRPTETIDIENKSKNGILLDSFQKEIINKFSDNYFSNNSLLFVDETNWIKLSIISSFIEYLRINIPNLTPILIITTSQYKMRWYQSLINWTTSNKIFMFDTEMKSSQESYNIYPFSNPVKFDIMIICREQFIQDDPPLPKIAWNAVIIDDLTVVKSPLFSYILQLNKMTFNFSIVISADFNSMKITDLAAIHEIIKCPELPKEVEQTAALYQSVIELSEIRVTAKEVAENYSFREHLLLCPMTQHQLKQYVQLFENCREDMSLEEINNIAKDLKNASTHPLLIESSKDQTNEKITSGKMVILGKILIQQKSEDRNVAIVCSSMKTVSLINALLNDRQISHIKFDSSARINQITKYVQQFNNSSGFSVIIIPQVSMKTVLPLLNANTIIAFDINWSPLNDPIGVVNWIGRSQTSPPKIYQLITKNSFEQLLFEHLWRNRDETIDQIAPENISSILKSAKVASDSIEAARGTSWASGLLKESLIINFSDFSLFNDEPEQISDEIWSNEALHSSQQTQQIQPKHQKIAAPPKPLPTSQFWDVEKLTEVASILNNFGVTKMNLLDKFGRPHSEVEKVVAVLLKHLLPENFTKKEKEKEKEKVENKADEGEVEETEVMQNLFSNYDNIRSFLSKFSPSDFHRFSLPALQETIETSLNPPMLLFDIELISELHKIVPDDIITNEEFFPDLSSITLEGKTSQPLSDDWTDQNDRELLYLASKFGLMNIPTDFSPQNTDQLVDRVRTVVQEIVKYDREVLSKPAIISLRKPPVFSIEDHRKIINALMDFGFPNIDSFVRSINFQRSNSNRPTFNQSVDRYVKSILRYCAASIDDRKSILPLLAEKIQKYNTTKIPQRVQLFQQIRESVHKYREFPAEDIEFLSAVSFHGFMNYSVSPILNVVCFGHCSEIKLFTKIKAIFSEKHRNRYNQAIPNDLKQRLPLKLNDMQVLTEIGEITNFNTTEYVYPVNYQCAVVANSPIHPDTQIWVYCTILEKEDEETKEKKPWFVVESKDGKEFKFEGGTPDEAFEAFRLKMEKRLGRFVPPFDGHEMFGLQSALIHRILIELPGIERCENYKRRFFRSCFQLVSKWPIIGQFEKEPEKQQNVAPAQQAQTSKFKYKRKNFGDIPQPLVLDFSPLFSQEKSGLVVDLRIPGVNCAQMVDNYSDWLQKMEPKK